VYFTVSVPTANAVSTPVVERVATVELVCDHAPPAVALVKLALLPLATVAGPLRAATDGDGLTCNACLAVADPQLLVTVYIMVSVPGAMPYTEPEVEMVAWVVLLTAHVPLETESVNRAVVPVHIMPGPASGATIGKGLTVMRAYATPVPQLFDNAYPMVTLPATSPATTPVVLTVAVAGVSDDHPPPTDALPSAIDDPTQTGITPVTGATPAVSTAILKVEACTPQALFIV